MIIGGHSYSVAYGFLTSKHAFTRGEEQGLVQSVNLLCEEGIELVVETAVIGAKILGNCLQQKLWERFQKPSW